MLCNLAFGASRATARRLSSAAPAAGARGFAYGAGKEHRPSGLLLSPGMDDRATAGLLNGIDLMVCDMAGTTVFEGGIVYRTLQASMAEIGLTVSDDAMRPWYGAKKEAVIEHFARAAGVPDSEVQAMVYRGSKIFESSIDGAYFSEDSVIRPIDPKLPEYFRALRKAGLRIGLDTGYPQHIQQGIVQRLGFGAIVDGYISSYEVAEGRPFPFMIHRLMERLRVEDVRRVCKVGDSARDVEEGLNAGCGLVVGVLSGADDAATLLAAGAHVVAPCVTDIPLPAQARGLAEEVPETVVLQRATSDAQRANV